MEQWARRPKTAQRLALRSRLVLRCAEGLSNQTVARGLARMRQRTVTICGICRDVAGGFPAVAARIERLGRMFRSYHGVFYENDSTDATPTVLRAWAGSNPAVRVFCERYGHPRFGQVRTSHRHLGLRQQGEPGSRRDHEQQSPCDQTGPVAAEGRSRRAPRHAAQDTVLALNGC